MKRDYSGGMSPIAYAEPDVRTVHTGKRVLVTVLLEGTLAFRASAPEDLDSDLLTVRDRPAS